MKSTHELIALAEKKAKKSEDLKLAFLSLVSHEVRTPINSIINYSQLIESAIDVENNKDLQMYFSRLKKASNRILRTMDSIVNMSELLNKSYEFKAEKIDVYDEVIEKYHQKYQQLAEKKGLKFSIMKVTDSTTIIGDKFSLINVYSNLLDNAIKYTEKGSINISIYKNELDSLIIEVKDSGVGISKEYLPQIFNLFSQETIGYTRNYDGNGLGLSLVKEYCELNRANVEIESKIKYGTKVIVKFPSL